MVVADPSVDGEVTVAVTALWLGSRPPFLPPRWGGWKGSKCIPLPRSVCMWNMKMTFTQARSKLK